MLSARCHAGGYDRPVAKPRKPTRTMLASIGRVAAESASVEDRLRDLFCYLIDSPFGRVITAGEDTSNIAKLCMRVARYNRRLTDEQVEQLAAIIKAVETLRPYRNFLVHARWERLSAPGEHYGVRSSRASTSVRAGTQGTSEAVVWTPKEAEEFADQFQQLSEYIDVFIERTFDRPPYVMLIERTAWDKFNAMFGNTLAAFAESRSADESSPASPPPSDDLLAL